MKVKGGEKRLVLDRNWLEGLSNGPTEGVLLQKEKKGGT